MAQQFKRSAWSPDRTLGVVLLAAVATALLPAAAAADAVKLTAHAAAKPAAARHAGVLALVRAATVPIVAFDEQAPKKDGVRRPTLFGAGFVFQDARHVATCATVIDAVPARLLLPQCRLAIMLPVPGGKGSLEESYELRTLKVVALDRTMDVALLEVDGDLPVKPLKATISEVPVGAELLVAGFHVARPIPLSFRCQVSAALAPVVAPTSPPNAAPSSLALLLLGSPLGAGCHGGPAVDPTSGDVVGVVKVHSRFLTRAQEPFESLEPDTWGAAVVVPVQALTNAARQGR